MCVTRLWGIPIITDNHITGWRREWWWTPTSLEWRWWERMDPEAAAASNEMVKNDEDRQLDAEDRCERAVTAGWREAGNRVQYKAPKKPRRR